MVTSLDSFHSCDGKQQQVLSLRDEICTCTLCNRRKKQTIHTVKSKVCLLGNHVVTLPDSLLLKSAVDKNSPRPTMWKRFSLHTAHILPPTIQLLTFSL
ncbi:hypothetical protein Q5P01_003516 [Channa striata]|uniref:Uncharacterized protein n=1 Tax=Channa striata TaxID=64152 RepID=A0AA88NJN8_CHASR|nr:hypothetical protein Q5P01_003516 [Channa striata]